MRHKLKMAVYRGETHDNVWGKAIEKVKNVFGIPDDDDDKFYLKSYASLVNSR